MRARKIGRWVGCAVIGGVLAVGVLIGISPASAEIIWERQMPSAGSDQPVWVNPAAATEKPTTPGRTR